MKTKAAILIAQHRPLEIVDLEIPRLSAHQVLVRVVATGVCGSQIGEIDGVKGSDPYLPHCLGHEAGGVVEDVGPGVRKVRPGQHGVLHWRPGSGHDAKPARYRWGSRAVNAGRVTTFQEFAVVSENRITPIPKNIPLENAALFGCAITTGFGIVQNDARVRPGQSVLVLGAGGIGQVEVFAAKDALAQKIIVCDLHASKRKLALACGATHAVSPGTNLEASVHRILEGGAPDVVLENTGQTHLIELAYRCCAPQGRVVLVGVPRHGELARIDTLPLHFGKILIGSHGGGARPERDIPRLLRLAVRSDWDLTRWMTTGYTLDRINEAISDLRFGRALRPMVRL